MRNFFVTVAHMILLCQVSKLRRLLLVQHVQAWDYRCGTVKRLVSRYGIARLREAMWLNCKQRSSDPTCYTRDSKQTKYWNENTPLQKNTISNKKNKASENDNKHCGFWRFSLVSTVVISLSLRSRRLLNYKRVIVGKQFQRLSVSTAYRKCKIR